MNNLKKFETEAEYQQASLNYPAVSWVTATDNVHFDKSGSTPTVNDKIMMAFSSDRTGNDIILVNLGSTKPTEFFNKIELNDVDVTSLVDYSGVLLNYSVANTDYLAKYDVKEAFYNSIFQKFVGDLGVLGSSDGVEILIPSQITVVDNMPNNITQLVIEATTPPTTSMGSSGYDDLQGIYVPDAALSAYQATWGGTFSDRIYPISEYQGNLPV
jgi:hypothetical protein